MANSLPIEERLCLLTAGARYDASCASCGGRGTGPSGRKALGGVCHSWTADGRCVSLLKVLLSNSCIYDCAYCVNRRSLDHPRVAFAPEEIARLTGDFYRRNYIEGLFLSTGVVKSPDYTMELLLRTARLLREESGFSGYLHLKLIPGADPLLVEQAGLLADRVSVNIELPSAESLRRIAPDKSREAVLAPMAHASTLIATHLAEEKGKGRRASPSFAPAGQSTQLIVGASPESDLQILRLAENLYEKVHLRRVYYSAFIPGSADPRLPTLPEPPLLREHRLYQADWLLRFYGFGAGELLDEENPHFDLRLDPKAAWALRHLELFPVEVNAADYEELLRIPGIGMRSARRIIRARRERRLSLDDLKRLGVVLKRARYFITAGGRYCGEVTADAPAVRERLLEYRPAPGQEGKQLDLFADTAPKPETALAAVTGEF
jgi:putative DNA modification/repair radical SAM protein